MNKLYVSKLVIKVIFLIGAINLIAVPLAGKQAQNSSSQLENHAFEFCIPVMQNEITVDGKIGEKEWENAGVLCTFFNLKGKIMPNKGIVYLGTNGKKLFIAVKTQIPINADGENTSGLKAGIKEHDAAVWKDDAVEIIIRNAENSLFQFIVNSLDACYDAKNNNKNWTAVDVQSKSNCSDGWWTLEMIIPLKILELSKDSLYINICRDWSRFGTSTITGGNSYFDLESDKTVLERKYPCHKNDHSGKKRSRQNYKCVCYS